MRLPIVINSNLGGISHFFRDTATYSFKQLIQKFNSFNSFSFAADRHMVTVDSL